jgi:hypothetical protein
MLSGLERVQSAFNDDYDENTLLFLLPSVFCLESLRRLKQTQKGGLEQPGVTTTARTTAKRGKRERKTYSSYKTYVV